MKRFILPAVVVLSWVFLIGASTGFQINGQEGWPPQTALYNDAAFLSRAIPFIIALGILAGIYQARQAAKFGGDAILGEKGRSPKIAPPVRQDAWQKEGGAA